MSRATIIFFDDQKKFAIARRNDTSMVVTINNDLLSTLAGGKIVLGTQVELETEVEGRHQRATSIVISTDSGLGPVLPLAVGIFVAKLMGRWGEIESSSKKIYFDRKDGFPQSDVEAAFSVNLSKRGVNVLIDIDADGANANLVLFLI